MNGLTKELAGALVAGVFAGALAFSEFAQDIGGIGGFAGDHNYEIGALLGCLVGSGAGRLMLQLMRRLPCESHARISASGRRDIGR